MHTLLLLWALLCTLCKLDLTVSAIAGCNPDKACPVACTSAVASQDTATLSLLC